MKVDDVVAAAFVKEGTTLVFGLLGDGQLKWWSAMSQYPEVKLIDVRDEGASLAMADGWARVTGKVAVCSVTQGPGVSRIATSLITAVRYHTPIVIYTSATGFNKDNAMQYLDQEKLVSATGAGYIEVLTADYAEYATRLAFYRAKLEGRPIVLSIPMDVQTKDCVGSGEHYVPSFSFYSSNQKIHPDKNSLKSAYEIILASKNPLIIAGRGVLNSPAIHLIKNLSNQIGALLASTLHAKNIFTESEFYTGIVGLFSTKNALELYKEVDCVIAMGSSLNNYAILANGKKLFTNAKIIHVDIEPHLLMGDGRPANCYVQSDISIFIELLTSKINSDQFKNQGFHTEIVREKLSQLTFDNQQYNIEENRVDPRELALKLDEILPMNIGLVVGDGHFMSFPTMLINKKRNFYLFSTAFGSIGQGLSTAIGASAECDYPVVCIEGDGGALQNIQELDTAARLGIKLLYIIMNDDAYGAEYHKLKVKNLDANLSAVISPNFAAIGRGFGCRGVTAFSLDDVVLAVKEFLINDGPMVLDVKISRNVISIPYRRMHLKEDV